MDLLNGVSSDKQILVSVIVPVYNVENYLTRCLTSLLAQTLKDIEIILVDDGSEDRSGAICDAYAVRDNRIRVVHKANGGLSSARNAGMRIATGKYFGFVDADDDVNRNMFEQMIRVAEKEQVDFIMCDYQRMFSDGSVKCKTLNIDAGYYDKQKVRDTIFGSLIMGDNLEYGPLLSVWHCIYRADFLRRYNLEFDEEVRWSEDNIFSAQVGYYCDTFYYLKGQALYHYYQNSGTITSSYRKNAWDEYSRMNDHLHAIFDTVSDYDFSDQLKWHLVFYACNCVGQEFGRDRTVAVAEIGRILDDKRLKAAFKATRFPNVPIKLKLQLFMMKNRMTAMLFYLKQKSRG